MLTSFDYCSPPPPPPNTNDVVINQALSPGKITAEGDLDQLITDFVRPDSLSL